MSRAEKVILTNMCLIEDQEGNVLVQDRPAERYAWSGIAFPGGESHIKRRHCPQEKPGDDENKHH